MPCTTYATLEKRKQWKSYGMWSKKYPEKHKIATKKYREKVKYEAYCVYSNPPRCKKCGINDLDVLAIDHINNDGHERRKDFKSHSSFYKNITKYKPNDLQLLCMNCNYKKHRNGGIL